MLGGYDRGDADRALHLYTREFGLVVAQVKSIRTGRSKLRYALQTFSLADIDLIRGRNGWKLTSARPKESFAALWSDAEKRKLLAQHVHLFRRLVQGEEIHAELFDGITSSFRFVSEGAHDEDTLRDIELLFVLRLLRALGYWGEKESDPPLLSWDEWSSEYLQWVKKDRSRLLAGVNAALRDSQL
ncbi:MAG: repair protein RecO protein [Candidatus Giovannonibacteria bacterium GW2011_GWA2_53_7]|uniref:Repair protein RecO protein n=1 Tax=Candidatus Giovannonibacteria bacterium GW2011_GWA2_53_7 TaxID=1618650 RepID=A0A0G2A2Y0_9BACT|nr:MAG: repair protein RecO protein [Candidatus Giovannonibacteria bacterium GW2011_GWA2_53_7]